MLWNMSAKLAAARSGADPWFWAAVLSGLAWLLSSHAVHMFFARIYNLAQGGVAD